MKRLWHFFLRRKHVWIAVVLLAANGLAWNAAAVTTLPQPDPVLPAEIATIHDNWRSGEAVGEPFSVVVTDQMAAETIAWFLSNHPEIPFSHPQVTFDPEGVTARGLAHLAGLRTPVYGRVSVRLRDDGVPAATLAELGVARTAAPAFLVAALRAEVDRQQQRFSPAAIPVTLTRLEFRQGAVLLEGVYR